MRLKPLDHEEKICRIAKAAGWKWEYTIEPGWRCMQLTDPAGSMVCREGFGPKKPSASLLTRRLKEWPLQHLPRYFHDLNATDQAETSLTDSEQSKYAECVFRLSKKGIGLSYFEMMRVPVAIRAEAFGLAKGLWETWPTCWRAGSSGSRTGPSPGWSDSTSTSR